MRRRGALARLALVALVGGGCELRESLGVYREHGGGSGEAATSAGTTTGGTGEGTTGATDTTTAATTGDAIPEACLPAADDDTCDACVKEACCEAVVACEDDLACVCMTSCVAGGEAAELCVGLCAPGAAYTSYIACLAFHCAPECAP